MPIQDTSSGAETKGSPVQSSVTSSGNFNSFNSSAAQPPQHHIGKLAFMVGGLIVLLLVALGVLQLIHKNSASKAPVSYQVVPKAEPKGTIAQGFPNEFLPSKQTATVVSSSTLTNSDSSQEAIVNASNSQDLQDNFNSYLKLVRSKGYTIQTQQINPATPKNDVGTADVYGVKGQTAVSVNIIYNQKTKKSGITITYFTNLPAKTSAMKSGTTLASITKDIVPTAYALGSGGGPTPGGCSIDNFVLNVSLVLAWNLNSSCTNYTITDSLGNSYGPTSGGGLATTGIVGISNVAYQTLSTTYTLSAYDSSGGVTTQSINYTGAQHVGCVISSFSVSGTGPNYTINVGGFSDTSSPCQSLSIGGTVVASGASLAPGGWFGSYGYTVSCTSTSHPQVSVISAGGYGTALTLELANYCGSPPPSGFTQCSSSSDPGCATQPGYCVLEVDGKFNTSNPSYSGNAYSTNTDYQMSGGYDASQTSPVLYYKVLEDHPFHVTASGHLVGSSVNGYSSDFYGFDGSTPTPNGATLSFNCNESVDNVVPLPYVSEPVLSAQ